MLSQMGCVVADGLRGQHDHFPKSLFALLEDPTMTHVVKDTSPCMLGEFSQGFAARHRVRVSRMRTSH